jgi:molecular chaperone DnaK (HSP70)
MRAAHLIALAAACLCHVSVCLGNVIGIDIGLDYMKVALVAPRKPLEIVTNTASKRKTEVAVAFDRGELSLGGDAAALTPRKPTQVRRLER